MNRCRLRTCSDAMAPLTRRRIEVESTLVHQRRACVNFSIQSTFNLILRAFKMVGMVVMDLRANKGLFRTVER